MTSKLKFQKLEMLRGFAAVYVFAHHFLLARILPQGSDWRFFFSFGQEAVMLFFIISGFVIYYSVAKHADHAFLPYLSRRARRIFPIYLLALAVSFASVFIAGHVTINKSFLWELIGNLLMLQDFSTGKPGVWFSPFCGDTALWSLSYEWWFYMMFFPVYRYVFQELRIHVVALISLVGFISYTLCYNQISLFMMYFVLWWSGAELGRCYATGTTPTFASQRNSLFYLTGFTALVATPVLSALSHHQHLLFGIHPVLELRHFSACLLFVVVGLLWARVRWVGFRFVFGAFVFIAPISYALYVFHGPLAVTASYLSGIQSWPLQLLGYLVLTFLVAYLAEIPLQNWINRKSAASTQRPNHALQRTEAGDQAVSDHHA